MDCLCRWGQGGLDWALAFYHSVLSILFIWCLHQVWNNYSYVH